MLLHMELFGVPIFHFVIGSPASLEPEYVQNNTLTSEVSEEDHGFAYGFAPATEA